MQDPGYLKARGAFLGSGAKMIPVPVDQEGLVVEVGIAHAPGALTYLAEKRQNGTMVWTRIGSCQYWAVLYTYPD